MGQWYKSPLDFEIYSILYLIFRHVAMSGTQLLPRKHRFFRPRQVRLLSCPAFSGAGATGRIAEEVVPAEDVDRNWTCWSMDWFM